MKQKIVTFKKIEKKRFFPKSIFNIFFSKKIIFFQKYIFKIFFRMFGKHLVPLDQKWLSYSTWVPSDHPTFRRHIY